MKLKKISIILIIFIAFMSIATASAMDDSSSVSLDDSSNYNASDLEIRIQYPQLIMRIQLPHLLKNWRFLIWIQSQELFPVIMRKAAIPIVRVQIQISCPVQVLMYCPVQVLMYCPVQVLMYCQAAVQMCWVQASL